MIIDILRIIGLIGFVVVIFTDIEIPIVLNTPLNQMILGLIIIITIIAVDEIIGFLLGLIILIIYYKYYQKLFNTNANTNTNNMIINELKEPLLNLNNNQLRQLDTFESDVKPVPNNKIESIGNHYMKMSNDGDCIEMPYISNELLENAQNNIYDMNNYNMELVSNDDNMIYGVQGLNSTSIHYPAYDKTNIINNYI
jgi:hypothetical protein